MIEKIKKVTKIIDELTTYLMIKGGKNLDIKINIIDRDIAITFLVDNLDFTRSELDELEDSLSIPRQAEVEEYYWQLNGGSETEMEFDLIGMMIDKYILEFTKGSLKLELIRKNVF
ncbi:hypothetical protein [uncultured Ilyobacter sp.]|uniref:hypothetical protein n=1 Tax=uncultured Ilyobacter sp. TaxID=544433 RepID=UPI0029C83727|nr:hypothetical protein [uncultured Ilyobacter sp.]